METKGKRVASVEKAVLLLECLHETGRWLTLGEICELSGLSKSTVHALLTAMMVSHIVEQDNTTGKYYLGYHLFELGCGAEEWWHVKNVALPHMRKITDETGESIYLAKRCVHDVLLVVEASETSDFFRVSAPVGSRLPLYCSSQGKSILAQLPREEQISCLRRMDLVQLTPHTKVEMEDILQDLEQVKKLGFSMEQGEVVTGMGSIAVPIYDSEGYCEYAIAVVYMSHKEISAEKMKATQKRMLYMSQNISAALQSKPGWVSRNEKKARLI